MGERVTGQESIIRTVQSSSGAMLDQSFSRLLSPPRYTRLSRPSRARKRRSAMIIDFPVLPLESGSIEPGESGQKLVPEAKWRASVRRLGAYFSM